MQFERVKHLKPGVKYKICQHFSQHRGIYLYSIYGVHTFASINGFPSFQDFFYDATFYIPILQKQRIQSNMEHRAVNLILQRITGDPTFIWVGASPYDP